MDEDHPVFAGGVGALSRIAVVDLLPHAYETAPATLLATLIVAGFFLWLKQVRRDAMTTAVLFGFYLHTVMEGAFVAITFTVGAVTGMVAVIGFVLTPSLARDGVRAPFPQ